MNSLRQNNALVLFAKAPIAGEVKTRLQPEITPENSARLQESLIKDSISLMSEINNVEKIIYFLPGEKKYIFEKFTDGLPFHLNCQNGVDLGEKMENAFQDLFNKGFFRVVIIGVDSPTLPKEYINKAFIDLNNADLVIGPSIDGGYYLIGFKEKVLPVFSSVEWGSNKVLLQTEELITKQNLKLSLLPVHYDIDTIEDLRYLKTHLKLLSRSGEDVPVNTMSILDNILRTSR
tara:strand:+ start:8957 stop:9655 length:699 start_codon:yes stop_codon:yes gene_type:complete